MKRPPFFVAFLLPALVVAQNFHINSALPINGTIVSLTYKQATQEIFAVSAQNTDFLLHRINANNGLTLNETAKIEEFPANCVWQTSSYGSVTGMLYLLCSEATHTIIAMIDTTTFTRESVSIDNSNIRTVLHAAIDEANDSLYISGTDQDSQHGIVNMIGRIGNISSDNQTLITKEYLPFHESGQNEFANAAIFDIDRNFAVFATGGLNPAYIKVNISNEMAVVEANSFSTPEVSYLNGVIYDKNYQRAFFYSRSYNRTAGLIAFDVANFRVISVSKIITGVSIVAGTTAKITTAAIDDESGQGYFLGGEGGGPFISVDLGRGRTSDYKTLQLGSTTYSSFVTSAIDIENSRIFVGAQQPKSTILEIPLPEVCPNDCSGKGDCVYGVCVCDKDPQRNSTWQGADCSTAGCVDDCNGHALQCDAQLCFCEDIWTGDRCQTRQCPKNCNGVGTCDTSTWTCQCPELTSPPSCAPDYRCSNLKTCDQCGDSGLNDKCVWCRTTKTCMDGDLSGPFNDTCLSWFYQECPEIGMEFWAYFFSFIAVLLLLINMVSVYIEDRDLPSNRPSSPAIVSDVMIKASWWRNQRSAKAWMMIDQIQFAAITAQFAVKSPSLYHNFVAIFRWSVIGFGLPWSQRHEAEPLRHLLSMEQFSASTQTYADEIIIGSLFWYAILIAFMAFVFVVILVANKIFIKLTNVSRFVKNRSVYTLLRILFFGYWPLVIYSTFSFTLGKNEVTIALAVVALVVVVLGSHAVIYFVVPFRKTSSNSKRIFEANFLRKFGCVYNAFYFKKSFYMHILLLKKLLFGVIVGVMQKYATAQLVVLIIIEIAYTAQLFFTKPYLDRMHTFLDVGIQIANIIVIGLMFGFLDAVNVSDDISVVLSALACAMLLLSQILCVAAFINSWLKMRNISSFKMFWRQCCGRRYEADADVIDIELPTTKVTDD